MDSVSTPGDFHLALMALRAQRGNPSLREVCALAEEAGHALARSTLADALARPHRLPTLELVEALLAAYEVPVDQRESWRWAWSKTAYLQQRELNESSGSSGRWHGGCPYQGLAPFEQDQAGIFYGREQETARLLAVLAARLDRGGLVAVTGASGVGKSSLLRAGLIPALGRGQLPGQPESRHWPHLVFTATGTPLRELATRIANRTGNDPQTVLDALVADPAQAPRWIRAMATAMTAITSPDHDQQPGSRPVQPPPLLLVVDQLEEIFTSVREDDPQDRFGHRAAFLDVLDAAATTDAAGGTPAALVVVAVRGDFIDRCAAHPPLVRALEQASFILGPMSQSQLRQAIIGPAAAAGLTVQEGLPDLVISELADYTRTSGGYGAGSLPLLSEAMRRTWASREGDQLTLRSYGNSGGIGSTVNTSAEDVYTSLTPAEQSISRQVLLRLTAISPDGQPSRRRVPRQELFSGHSLEQTDAVRRVLDAFTDHRLLVASTEEVTPGTEMTPADERVQVELAHDVLLIAWPRLRAWLEEDQENLVLHSELIKDAAVWEASGQDASYLYSGARLAAAQQVSTIWQDTRHLNLPLPSDAEHFLEAGQRAELRRTRLRRMTVIALATLLIVAIVAAAVAVGAARIAESRRLEIQQEKTSALAGQIAMQSKDLLASDPTTAQRLALAAYQIDPTSKEAWYSMRNALANPARQVLTGHADSVSAVAFSPDGRTLATADNDGTVRLWDAGTRRLIGDPLTGHSYPVSAVVFSPDGRRLATASDDGAERLWDVAARRLIGEQVTGHPYPVSAAVFSPDGRTLATASYDGRVRLWDVAARRPIGDPLIGHTGPVYAVAFNPDGRTLATAGSDKVVRLWDVDSHHLTDEQPTGHTGPVSAVAFSPDGRRLATAGEDRMVRLWDAATRRLIGGPLTGHTGLIAAVVFSPDGRTLATASDDGTVRLWDVGTRRLISAPLAGHAGPIAAVVFSPDGRTLATASDDKTVRLWDVATRYPTGNPLTGPVYAVAFNPDGRTLATASDDGAVRLWDVAARRLIGDLLTGHTGRVAAVVFSPDGRTLATASHDKTVRLWDVAARRLIGDPLTGHSYPVSAVVFSPDGRTLATASYDGTVRLWDAATHRLIGVPLIGHTGPVYAVVFSPDGRTLATASEDETVRLWDAATHRPIGDPLIGHTGPVYAVVFSPDGRTLATASEDETVRLWDATTRRLIGAPLTGHTGPIPAVVFSPDGRTLATASEDETVRLWDAATRRLIGDPLTGYTGPVYAVAFSPDGRTLATASDDETARLWDMSLPADLFRALCMIANGSLTYKQWAQYLPAEPFQQGCPPSS